MRALKKLLCAALLVVAGCSAKVDQPAEPVNVLVPNGATAFGMLSLYDGELAEVTTVSGTDVLTAELSKDDSTYDIIVAPLNLGAKMEMANNSTYELHSILTWGNLYLVGTDESALESEGTFAAFGEGAVPQKILTSSLDMDQIVPEVVYYGGVENVQQELLAQNANVALMAEPAATATIAKAKQAGIELKVLKDLQEEYQKKTNSPSYGYPQAAIFVKKGCADKAAAALESVKTFVNETSKNEPDKIKELAEAAGTEKIGNTKPEIIQKTWARQNLNVVPAKEKVTEIKEFLKLFNIDYSEEYIVK